MPEFVERAWPYLIATVWAVFLVMLAPLTGAMGRKRIAVVFALGAVAALVAAVVQMSETRTLEISNPFFRAAAHGTEELYFFKIATVEAPGWQWGVAAALALLIPAVGLWSRRGRGPAAPSPVPAVALVGVWILGTRVILELTAAPHALVWAIGINWAHFALFFMVGWYTGLRGGHLKVLLLAVFGSSMVLRLMVTGLSYLATTGAWDIWVNMNTVTDFKAPGLDPVDLAQASPTAKWFQANFMAQVFQGLFAFMFGTVMAIIPWAIARRRAVGVSS